MSDKGVFVSSVTVSCHPNGSKHRGVVSSEITVSSLRSKEAKHKRTWTSESICIIQGTRLVLTGRQILTFQDGNTCAVVTGRECPMVLTCVVKRVPEAGTSHDLPSYRNIALL
jgi:hypothetical protein